MNFLKPTLVAALLVASTLPTLAADLGQPDCSKTPAYIQELTKQGFYPLLIYKDILNPDVNHSVAYNDKTHELISMTTDGKTICVNSIGKEAVAASPEHIRTFLDQTLENKPQG